MVFEKDERNYALLNGTYDEISTFLDAKPKILLINCSIARIGSDGILSMSPHLVGAIFWDGKYFICGGEHNSKVYKVCDPVKLFFSPQGHETLLIHLAKAYTGMTGFPRVVFNKTSDNIPRDILCMPKLLNWEPKNWNEIK